MLKFVWDRIYAAPCNIWFLYPNVFKSDFLITGIHCIRHAGYKNIMSISRRCSHNRHVQAENTPDTAEFPMGIVYYKFCNVIVARVGVIYINN